jgi:tetrahydromethanopterin S-methyltransferase subunit F
MIADEKPEVAAGAGLAAGFVFAMILRRLAS